MFKLNEPAFHCSIIILTSCADKTVKECEQLIYSAERIVVRNQEHRDSVDISIPSHLQNLKEVLKQNRKPESPREFVVDRTIAIYADEKRTGLLCYQMVLIPTSTSDHTN